MDAVGGDVGDIEATVRADLQPVRDRLGAGQAAKILDAAIGALSLDVPGVGLAPDDRAVRLDRYAVREGRLVEADSEMRGAVGVDGKDVAGIWIRRGCMSLDR